ncbi:transglycosylase SLT domain-containing protein [Amycolatopsis cynarae]|uniref:Transglycosylase SLT domain-containing protein n=1 Tax=Amycolatopsis cynarae TaxID=2995223 RepID=A0ABY7BC63_9PSEU|nr:transglycosylase SLT domain-containing protein [Amycolatopsis sp. HUAS 11-8]WAL68228.1 transglycosylase SLT domain-containing protein [Amycolatopsis sp. HUAS 11-8]
MRWGRRVALAVLVPVLAGCAVTGNAPSGPTTPPPSSASAPAPATSNQDPAKFAAQVVAHAREAGVDAQLVMAILYNESYKPHDPELERAWQQLHPDAAFGVANMHRAAFDETKRGRPFAGRDWQDLPDDPDLAIQAEAWYLHDLAAQLPATRSGRLTTNELLALGYNTGPGNMRAFARGTTPGSQAQSYLDTLHANWAKAGQAVAHG